MHAEDMHNSLQHSRLLWCLRQDFKLPPEEKPPLLIKIHGGPTSQASTAFSLGIQYWTSRGYAIADGKRASHTPGSGEGQTSSAPASSCTFFRLLTRSNVSVPYLTRCPNMHTITAHNANRQAA